VVSALLARLDNENLFIEPVQGPDRAPWYRLHPLLRETLAERFRQRSEAVRHQVHMAAWQWFRDHRLLVEAVRHAVLAGESGTAADLVERYSSTLIGRGEVRKVAGLLQQLPKPEVRARPALRLLTVQMQLYAHEVNAARAELDALDGELPAEGTAPAPQATPDDVDGADRQRRGRAAATAVARIDAGRRRRPDGGRAQQPADVALHAPGQL
jgi:LuxR family maltose regulon positive regulatory protein